MSQSASADVLKLVLANLSSALTYSDQGNIRTNAKLWDRYAENYYTNPLTEPSSNKDEQSTTQSTNHSTDQSTNPPLSDWVLTMASQVGRDASMIRTIGDEWSDEQSLTDTFNEYLFPYINQSMTVGELGTGGGRCMVKVAPRVDRLIGFDISSGMINQCKNAMKQFNIDNVELNLLPINQSTNQSAARPSLPKKFHQTFDFFYCFDVFVHCDLHTTYGYLLSIKECMKRSTQQPTNQSQLQPTDQSTDQPTNQSSKVFISTSNLASPLGWSRFEAQTRYSEAGFYFVTPDQVRLLIDKAGFRIVKESKPDPNSKNMYINRDYLAVMELKE